ncbi:uncharacterized protein ATNIH1004_001964 [Aspergillus tanneri]|uniref:Uncharacterized protein n=1 Tax=Aspergillus tanneri TaxID=1220188 RepID=A0A5M9M2U1_9EURO|nr:uncharacterized protein ATNIH1004_001964 [Aspergillus tanneri]KAA8641362.1 hypothetical protein ATNIH1004_001964 [Aspergillus tanneri]
MARRYVGQTVRRAAYAVLPRWAASAVKAIIAQCFHSQEASGTKLAYRHQRLRVVGSESLIHETFRGSVPTRSGWLDGESYSQNPRDSTGTPALGSQSLHLELGSRSLSICTSNSKDLVKVAEIVKVQRRIEAALAASHQSTAWRSGAGRYRTDAYARTEVRRARTKPRRGSLYDWERTAYGAGLYIATEISVIRRLRTMSASSQLERHRSDWKNNPQAPLASGRRLRLRSWRVENYHQRCPRCIGVPEWGADRFTGVVDDPCLALRRYQPEDWFE